MTHTFTQLTDPKYQVFKNKVAEYQHGIIDFVDISDLRAQGMSDDAIADVTSEYFDPEEWPIRKDPNSKVEGPFWPRINEASVHESYGVIAVLAGGPNFGHYEYAVQPEEAERLWEEFLAFFDKDTRVLYGVTLGSESYVFRAGVLIVDKDKSGVLNILAND